MKTARPECPAAPRSVTNRKRWTGPSEVPGHLAGKDPHTVVVVALQVAVLRDARGRQGNLRDRAVLDPDVGGADVELERRRVRVLRAERRPPAVVVRQPRGAVG